MDLRSMLERQDLNRGFGESSARAIEIVLTTLVFGWIGWWLDGRFGTRPVIALTLGIVVLLVELWKLSKGYMVKMDAETRKVLKRDV